jgi:hypothetical protein
VRILDRALGDGLVTRSQVAAMHLLARGHEVKIDRCEHDAEELRARDLERLAFGTVAAARGS